MLSTTLNFTDSEIHCYKSFLLFALLVHFNDIVYLYIVVYILGFTENVLWLLEYRICTMLLYCPFVLRYCTMILYNAIVLRFSLRYCTTLFTTLLYSVFVLCCCTTPFTSLLFYAFVLIYCTATLYFLILLRFLYYASVQYTM